MIGILVAAHGKYASGLLDGAKLILGEYENMDSLELTEGLDLDLFKEDYYQKIKALDNGKGVLVFVDLFGATPFNTAGSLLGRLTEEGIKIRVITGVNLPMVLEGSFMREQHDSVDSLYKSLVEVGHESILEMKETMGL